MNADEEADAEREVLENWLRGIKKYQPYVLRQVAYARLKKTYGKLSELVIPCVAAKIVPEDEVCPELRKYLPAKAGGPPNANDKSALKQVETSSIASADIPGEEGASTGATTNSGDAGGSGDAADGK
jgi:hypothetical protein